MKVSVLFVNKEVNRIAEELLSLRRISLQIKVNRYRANQKTIGSY